MDAADRIAQLERELALVLEECDALALALAQHELAMEGLRWVQIAVSMSHALDLIHERKAIAARDCKRSYSSGFAPMQ